DAAARFAGFATIEGDAGELAREMIEQLDPRVDPLRAPLLARRVEAAGREHQQWRSGPQHVGAGGDPVGHSRRHRWGARASPGAARAMSQVFAGRTLARDLTLAVPQTLGLPPRICRAARTSSANALNASSAVRATLA